MAIPWLKLEYYGGGQRGDLKLVNGQLGSESHTHLRADSCVEEYSLRSKSVCRNLGKMRVFLTIVVLSSLWAWCCSRQFKRKGLMLANHD